MNKALPKRKLGETDLEISLPALGAAPIADLYEIIDEERAVGTLVSAIHQGVNLIDTSPLYGMGLSELRVGAALRHTPEYEVMISSKVGRVTDPFTPPSDRQVFAGGLNHSVTYDYSYDGVMRSIEQSLLRLGRDKIDLVLVHDLDQWTHGDAFSELYEIAMNGAVVALKSLREQGTIRAFGAGLNDADAAEKFSRDCSPDAILLAGRYSLLEQPALDSFLPLAKELGIGVILGGVFNSGILATGAIKGARYDYAEAPAEIIERVRRIESVCERHQVPLRRAAVQFAIAHPAVSSLILGAAREEEVSMQIEDVKASIPEEIWSELKELGLINSQAPTPVHDY
ncbi:MAG: aldo/keto reductase [Verrucomicrobiales bacterium]|nr:aldo/keto reductase [Verrucomicrobiales bacterium]